VTRPLPVDQALALVLQASPILPPEEIPFAESLGRVLQEEVRADHDYPDFDKALMDGYALAAADLRRAEAASQSFRISRIVASEACPVSAAASCTVSPTTIPARGPLADA